MTLSLIAPRPPTWQLKPAVHDPPPCATPTIRVKSLAALHDYKVGPFFAKLEGGELGNIRGGPLPCATIVCIT